MSSLPSVISGFAPALATAPGSRMAAAWVVFAAVTAILALFLVGITALIMLRRARAGLERPPRGEAPEPLPDAWAEAGSRVHPYPLPDED